MPCNQLKIGRENMTTLPYVMKERTADGQEQSLKYGSIPTTTIGAIQWHERFLHIHTKTRNL